MESTSKIMRPNLVNVVDARTMIFNTLSCMSVCATMLEISPRRQQHKIKYQLPEGLAPAPRIARGRMCHVQGSGDAHRARIGECPIGMDSLAPSSGAPNAAKSLGSATYFKEPLKDWRSTPLVSARLAADQQRATDMTSRRLQQQRATPRTPALQIAEK